MTVLPGSLDYLYYSGIIDHIPYEAYEQIRPQSNSVNNSSHPNINIAPENDIYESSEKKKNTAKNIIGCVSAAVILTTFCVLLCRGCKGAKKCAVDLWEKVTPEKWHKKTI